MARELTEQEKEALSKAIENYEPYYAGYEIEERQGFETGFAAALDYRQGQIDDLLTTLAQIAAGHPSTSPGKPELWLSALDMTEMACVAIAKTRGQ